MAVHNGNYEKGYTKMSNEHLRDRRLSNKAKGLMSMLLSLPKTWRFSVQGLMHLWKDQKGSVESGLREVEAMDI